MKKGLLFMAALCSLVLTACQAAGSTDEKEAADAQTVYRYQEERTAYQPGEPENLPQGDYGDLTDAYETAAGEVYYLYQEDNSLIPDDPDFTYHILKCGKEGTDFEELPLKVSAELYLEKIMASDAGDILLFDWSRAYVYKAGSSETHINFPAFFRCGAEFLDESHVVCKAHVSSAYLVFDIGTGEKTEEYLGTDMLYGSGSSYNTLIDGGPDGLLLVTGSGIYSRDQQSGEWTLEVPSLKTSMYLTDFDPTAVWRDGGDYYVSDKDTLYHYSRVEASAAEETRLKVLSVCENGFLKEAMVRYQIEHPEITIDYEIMEKEAPSDSQEMNALLQRVNTQMMSHEAADIYDLAYLPWEDYAERGYLADLSEVTETYAENEDYFHNVLNAYAEEGGTYAIPLSFYADYIFCHNDLQPYVDTIHEFARYLTENQDAQGLYPYYFKDNCYGYFLPVIYHFYSQDLYADGEITPESLRSFLEAAKVIWDRLSSDTGSATDPYRNSYKPNEEIAGGVFSEAMIYESGANAATMLSMDGVGVVRVTAYHLEDYAKISTGRFHPVLAVGVSQMSSQKEAAFDFVKYMVAYEEEASMVKGKR